MVPVAAKRPKSRAHAPRVHATSARSETCRTRVAYDQRAEASASWSGAARVAKRGTVEGTCLGEVASGRSLRSLPGEQAKRSSSLRSLPGEQAKRSSSLRSLPGEQAKWSSSLRSLPGSRASLHGSQRSDSRIGRPRPRTCRYRPALSPKLFAYRVTRPRPRANKVSATRPRSAPRPSLRRPGTKGPEFVPSIAPSLPSPSAIHPDRPAL
jgi:hypothetical protein